MHAWRGRHSLLQEDRRRGVRAVQRGPEHVVAVVAERPASLRGDGPDFLRCPGAEERLAAADIFEAAVRDEGAAAFGRVGWLDGRVEKRVAVRLGHGVPVTTARLSMIRRVRGGPCLVVQRAIEALRDAVVGEDVRVEKDAGRVGAVCGGVVEVVLRLGEAGRRASLGGVALGLGEREVLVAHIAVVGSVDGAT